jgi:hypothetical protein
MSMNDWQRTLEEAPARGHNVRTWADAFGVWHALVVVPTVGKAPGAIDTAHAAIAVELAARGNDATLAWLDSEDGLALNEAEPARRGPEGIHYHYMEVSQTPEDEGSASANPAYPNGQCPACGWGLDEAEVCRNAGCSNGQEPYSEASLDEVNDEE